MAFSAGGANVGGVQQTEQGTLITTEIDTAFSVAGGENLTVDFTVPAGKRWIIKQCISSSASFVGTLSITQIRINTNGALYPVLNSGTTSPIISFFPYTQLILTAGQKIRFSFTTTAWTSGQIHCDIVYLESSV